MESLTGPDLKTETFREIFEYRNRFFNLFYETFKLAERAVKKILIRQDAAIVNLDVDSHLTTEPYPNQKELLYSAANQQINEEILKPVLKLPAVLPQIPVAKVIFNQPYKVEIIDWDFVMPTWFWLKLMGSSPQRMEEELEETYRFHPKIEELPILGSFVVCRYDNKFCRAKVVTTVERKPREFSIVEMILVDYGQMKTAYMSDLYPIESRFCTEPAIGFLCGLKDVQPVHGDLWQLGSINVFNKQCRGELTAIFHSPSEELTETFSKLKPDFLVSLHNNGSIRSVLIKEGMAKDGSSNSALQLPVWSPGGAPPPARPMSASSKQKVRDVTTSSLRSSFVDGDVDSNMKTPSSPPQTIPEKLDEETDPVPVLHRPVDKFLMDQFLQSLDCRSTTYSVQSVGSDGLSRMSFASAATLMSKHSKQSRRIHLDYKYGQVLERRPAPSSTKLTVQLLHVFHPNLFYVHIKDEVPTLVEPLVKRLNDLYRHSKPVPVQRPEIGSFWVAKEKTMNNWARVQVVKVDVVQGVTRVTVFSVDWGFVEVVELSQLRPLVHQVSETPCLALCCRLAGVYPLNKSIDFEDWPNDATDTFIKWTRSEDDFLALVEDRDQKDGQWSVLMFKGLEGDEITINELLVNLKLASSNLFPLRPRGVEPNANKPIKENALKLPSFDLPVSASPNPGSTVLLRVTCVSRSYRFYCVLLPRDIFSVNINNEDCETLETLQAAIQKEYNENHHSHRVILFPSDRDIVIARLPDDKMWYRGRVIKKLENEEFSVHFVDIGYKRPVPMKDVCLPLNRFTHLPMQAVEMFLNGIDRDSDTIEARKELVELVQGKDLLAHVIQDTPKLLVDLYEISGLERVDLAEELIRRGVVKRGLSLTS